MLPGHNLFININAVPVSTNRLLFDMANRIKSISFEFDPFMKDEDAERLIDKITEMGFSITHVKTKEATPEDYVARSKLPKWDSLHNTITGSLLFIKR